jgi:hypothetical protein
MRAAAAQIDLDLSPKASGNVADHRKGKIMPDAMEEPLYCLPHLSKPALCKLWQELFKKEPPPEIRKDLMLRIVAHYLQEREFGRLSDAACRRLRQLASAFDVNPDAAVSTRSSIKSGTRLVRQWKEQVHVVEVQPEGYEYKGARYESLSEIARLITGTRWSGPLFFGLKAKQSKESQEAQ